MKRRFERGGSALILVTLSLIGCKNGAESNNDPPKAPTTPPTVPSSSPPTEATTTASVAAPTASTPAAVTCNATDTRRGAERAPGQRGIKIVGGEAAGDDYPFAVALATGTGNQLRQYCGGALIDKQWVLTAAHCLIRVGESAIVGRKDLSKPGGQVVVIDKVLNHADYDPDTNDNDIAVVRLANPVEVETVSLYSGDKDLAGDSSVVVGWGHLQEGGPASSKLQEVSIPVVSNATCTAGYAPDGVGITANMLCAGLARGGKDSCQGDSGGPLLVRGAGGKLQQAGVVSFGIGCARPNRYGVYTRVSKYVPWVRACTTSQ